MPAQRILIVSGFKVFPTYTGGHLHTGGIAKALARLGYAVHLYSFAGRQEHYRLGKPAYLIEQIEPGLVEETHLGWIIGLIQAVYRRLKYPRVWQYRLMSRGLIPARMKQALREADLILSDLPFCPIVPGPWSQKPWFMISHNLEHELLEQGQATERRYAGWMKQIECTAPSRYRDIFACAEGDQAFFKRHDASGRHRVPIICSGVDEQAYRVAPGTRERLRAELGVAADERLVIFSGSNFGPNIDALAALKAFCRAQADWLRQTRIRLLVAGSMEKQAGQDGAILTTGRVPDMVPYFAAADAGLNPVTRGSGANVKLFEYLAARLPVISTSFGVRGSALEPGRDYLEFDPADPRAALQALAQRDREHWLAHAEAVWQRHRSSCEIQELVRVAVAQRPEFEMASKDGGP